MPTLNGLGASRLDRKFIISMLFDHCALSWSLNHWIQMAVSSAPAAHTDARTARQTRKGPLEASQSSLWSAGAGIGPSGTGKDGRARTTRPSGRLILVGTVLWEWCCGNPLTALTKATSSPARRFGVFPARSHTPEAEDVPHGRCVTLAEPCRDGFRIPTAHSAWNCLGWQGPPRSKGGALGKAAGTGLGFSSCFPWLE